MKKLFIVLAAVLLFVILACSGGGSSDAGGGSSTPAASTLNGVAAVGTPIVSGTINVICAAGSSLTTTTSSTGTWQVTLSGQTFPCAVEVTGGTINGETNSTSYNSIAITTGNVNVTPLTDLMVANIVANNVGTEQPSIWFAGLSSDPTPLTAINQSQMTTTLTNLSTSLSGLSQLSTNNPITTVFTPSLGNVSDDMLAALAIAIISTGVSYESLLNDALHPTFTVPAGFNTALQTAYTGVSSGTGNYTIGGTVTGLTGTVVLQDNASDNLAIATNGSFTFPTAVVSGSAYSVTVLTNPSNQSCTITSGSGTATTDVTSVAVNCTNTPSAGYISQGGLTWMPIPPTFYTYAQATTLCAGTINGQTGWRLPTQPELSALFDSGAVYDQNWSPNANLTLNYTWSSTSPAAGEHDTVLYINPAPGVYSYAVSYNLDTGLAYVTCVH